MLRGNLSGLDSVGMKRGNVSGAAVDDEDLKKKRERIEDGYQSGKSGKRGDSLSMMLVLGVSACGGLVAFCIIMLSLCLIIRKRRKRSNQAPIVRRERISQRAPSAGRLSLLVNQVQSSEARLGSIEQLLRRENLEQLSPRLGRIEQLLVTESSETTRELVSSTSSLSSFQSRRKVHKDQLDQVSKSKKGGYFCFSRTN